MLLLLFFMTVAGLFRHCMIIVSMKLGWLLLSSIFSLSSASSQTIASSHFQNSRSLIFSRGLVGAPDSDHDAGLSAAELGGGRRAIGDFYGRFFHHLVGALPCASLSALISFETPLTISRRASDTYL
jgi:hypothetical protein